MRCHCTPIRMATMKKAATTSNVGEDAENKASLNITGGNVKLFSHSRKHSDSVTG